MGEFLNSGLASRRVLRLIAAFKFGKAAVLLAAGVGALKLLRADRAAMVQSWLVGLSLERDRHIAAIAAERALALFDLAGPTGFSKLAAGAFLFATVFLVEGVGLALAKRWAEYLTVAATSLFLPVEAVAVWHHWTPLRGATLAVNLVAVVYLVARIGTQRGSDRS